MLKYLFCCFAGGGSGFIGTALSNTLRLHGYDVVIVSRIPGPFCMTWGDLEKNGLPKNTQAVVSLAGQNILDMTRRWTPGFQQTVRASRLLTTHTLAQAIEQAIEKPKVFVSVSGVGNLLISTTYDSHLTCLMFIFRLLSSECRQGIYRIL